MARTSATRAEAIEQLILGFEQSGMTRRGYCDLRGIPVSTLDYYRRRRQEQQSNKAGQQRLVRVEVLNSERQERQSADTFTLALTKGRRIESTWNFGEQELMRLIRIVEAA